MKPALLYYIFIQVFLKGAFALIGNLTYSTYNMTTQILKPNPDEN